MGRPGGKKKKRLTREAGMNGTNPLLNQIWICSMAYEEPSCKFNGIHCIFLLVKDVFAETLWEKPHYSLESG